MEELRFFLFICCWAVAGYIALELNLAHPMAIAAVWLVGFVWLTGWLAAGPKAADALVANWLGMLAGLAALGGMFALLSLPFS
jgi:hypothetical protein